RRGRNRVSRGRRALASLAGAGEDADDGQFRPLTVKTRPGSIFESVYPAPSFVYWACSIQLIDGFHRALAPVLPRSVAAETVADYLVCMWWGYKQSDHQKRTQDSE